MVRVDSVWDVMMVAAVMVMVSWRERRRDRKTGGNGRGKRNERQAMIDEAWLASARKNPRC